MMYYKISKGVAKPVIMTEEFRKQVIELLENKDKIEKVLDILLEQDAFSTKFNTNKTLKICGYVFESEDELEIEKEILEDYFIKIREEINREDVYFDMYNSNNKVRSIILGPLTFSDVNKIVEIFGSYIDTEYNMISIKSLYVHNYAI